MTDYAFYARELWRQLHRYPEIGDIPYTEKFGKSSVIATINEEKSAFTIGIRADMNGL